jgi:DNA replication protein DnaC
MLTQPTIDKLKELKFYGMAEAFLSLQNNVESKSMSFEDIFGIIVDREITVRYDKRQKRLLKAAKLRIPEACPEDINYEHVRGLERNKMITLIQCDWIKQHQNVIFTGPCGIGKTYLVCALGQRACREGLSVHYFRMPRLFELLRAAQAVGRCSALMSKLSKIDLIIFDDFGLGELNMTERQDLLEVLESRNGLRSTAVTTQLPIDLWHQYIGDAMIADAILRRLLNCSHKIELDGEMLDQK